MPLRHLILWPTLIILFVLLMVGWIFFSPQPPIASNSAPVAAPAPQDTKPELISDPGQTPPLAEAAGQDAFTGNCLNCHSARYVLMQPPFPRKVWKAEVSKMVEAYKAPITAPEQEQIVNYLTVAYGAEDSQ